MQLLVYMIQLHLMLQLYRLKLDKIKINQTGNINIIIFNYRNLTRNAPLLGKSYGDISTVFPSKLIVGGERTLIKLEK